MNCQALFSTGKSEYFFPRECKTLMKGSCDFMDLQSVGDFTVITLSIGTDMPEQTVDLDQMLQNVASDLVLHCLPLVQLLFRRINR